MMNKAVKERHSGRNEKIGEISKEIETNRRTKASNPISGSVENANRKQHKENTQKIDRVQKRDRAQKRNRVQNRDRVQKIDCVQKKTSKEDTWIHLMKIGEKTGCHQRADRSFFYKGMQFPVCARCTGVFIAYIGSILYFICCFVGNRNRRTNGRANRRMKERCNERKEKYKERDYETISAIIGCLLMFFDWLLQALHIKESTNVRRLITGFAGGLGIMHFYRVILRILYRKGKELFD